MPAHGISGNTFIPFSTLTNRAGLSQRPSSPPSRPEPAADSRAGIPRTDSAPYALQRDIPQPQTPTAPGNETPTTTPPAGFPATDTAALRLNAQLINEALRNLGATGANTANSLLFRRNAPFLSTLQATRGLDPLQRRALEVNAALRNLDFTSTGETNPFLLNVMPPALEAAGITQNLDILGQSALQFNETLRTLGIVPAPIAPPQPQTAAAQAVMATGLQAQTATPATAQQAANINALETEAEPTAPATAAAAAPPAPAPPAGANPAIPVPPVLPEQGLTPATLPLNLFPERAIYVFAVYLFNDPAFLVRNPEPAGRDLEPTIPVTETKPIGDTRLRRMFSPASPRGERHPVEYILPPTAEQAERSIRHAIGHANSEIEAHGLPLHLVFAKSDAGFALNVYDCSYEDACRVVYDVPISLDNLSEVLAKLQYEANVIVDETS